MFTKRDLLRSAALAAITASTAKSVSVHAQTSADRPEACLNRLLQQNLPEGDITPRIGRQPSQLSRQADPRRPARPRAERLEAGRRGISEYTDGAFFSRRCGASRA